jgi:hypothetical protein
MVDRPDGQVIGFACERCENREIWVNTRVGNHLMSVSRQLDTSFNDAHLAIQNCLSRPQSSAKRPNCNSFGG